MNFYYFQYMNHNSKPVLTIYRAASKEDAKQMLRNEDNVNAMLAATAPVPEPYGERLDDGRAGVILIKTL